LDPLATVGWNLRQKEIDELRAENELLRLRGDTFYETTTKMHAENQRLRAALEAVATNLPCNVCTFRAQEDPRRTARVALDRAT
jgi:hypothetical protein